MSNLVSGVARKNDRIRRLLQEIEFAAWKLSDGEKLPTLAKYRLFRNYIRSKNIRTVIETGTYLGDFVTYLRRDFDMLYSIELSESLYRQAMRRVKNVNNVSLFCGDSSKILPVVLNSISSQCGFWLDAHASGGITAKGSEETPIQDELRSIMEHARSRKLDHVILVDDASCFGRIEGYPNLFALENLVSEYDRKWQINIMNNIIIIAGSQ